MTWLSNAIVQNGEVRVQTRNSPTGTPEWFQFTLLKRVSGNAWSRVGLTGASPGNIVITGSDAASYRGFLLGTISSNAIHIRHVTLRPLGQNWQITVNYERSMGLQWFGTEMYQIRQVRGLRLAQRLAIVVAIVTGVSMAAGFGPLAGAFGLAASGGTGTAVTVGAISGALSTFLHQNFLAMVTAVERDPENGAAHFYRANSTNFQEILGNSLVAGAFGGATAMIPGPRGSSSLTDVVTTIGNRMGNAFAGIVQSLVAAIVSGDHRRRSAREIESSLQQGLIRDLAIRALG